MTPTAPAAQAEPEQVLAGGDTTDSFSSFERSAAPQPIFRTGWLRRSVIWTNAASVPGFFVGDLVGIALVLVAATAVVVWSGVVATNVRRAHPAGRHSKAPNPLLVALSWFVAPIVGFGAGFSVAVVSIWTSEGTFEQKDGRSMVLVVTVIAAGLAILMAAYLPYRLLAKCARRVKADPGSFRKWFVAPIVAAILAAVAQVLAGLVLLSDGADGSSGGASIAAAALWLSSFALPWLAWLVFGSRAMRALESGVQHAHERGVRESQDPREVNPHLVHQAAAVGAGPFSAPIA